jgi:hypothetical protein
MKCQLYSTALFCHDVQPCYRTKAVSRLIGPGLKSPKLCAKMNLISFFLGICYDDEKLSNTVDNSLKIAI